MSDSEYYSYDDHQFEAPVTIKNKPKKVLSKRFDSEETQVLKEQTTKKRKAPVAVKRSDEGETKGVKEQTIKKQKGSTFKTSVKRNEDTFDYFGLLTEQETATVGQQETSPILPSVLTSRVANGSVVRRKHINGEFYVEVKVYKTSDAISARPEERWQKALNSVKIQMNPDGDEWKQLQGFFKAVRNVLDDTESVFYAKKAI